MVPQYGNQGKSTVPYNFTVGEQEIEITNWNVGRDNILKASTFITNTETSCQISVEAGPECPTSDVDWTVTHPQDFFVNGNNPHHLEDTYNYIATSEDSDGHGSGRGGPLTITLQVFLSGELTDTVSLEQDNIDRIRQEYVDHQTICSSLPIFARSEFCTCSSTHFSFEELTVNCPVYVTSAPLQEILLSGLEAIRSGYGGPLILNSCYRNPQKNEAVGGASCSQHQLGLAADIRVDSEQMWNQLKAIAEQISPVPCIEQPWDGVYRLHVDWRTGECPPPGYW